MYIWLIVAGILLIAELLTGTFYLLMLALASIFTWFAMLAGAGFLMQAVVFLISASVLVYLTRRWRAQINQKNTPNLADNLDAGEIISAHNWIDGIGHTHYRGTQWRVLLDTPDDAPLTDGSYRIVKLDGVHIRVARLNPNNQD
jgi:membrane protein implicated in regulation of membrane protease activity